MPTSPIAQAIFALVLASCALAWWKGSAAERIGGTVVAAGIAAGVLVGLFLSDELAPIFYLAGDGLIALALLAATLRYGSLWLGGAMLLYAAQFALHGYYFVTERAPDRFHAVFNNLNLLSIVALLLVGTLTAWLRRVRARAAA